MEDMIVVKEVNGNFSKHSFTFSYSDDSPVSFDIDDKELFIDMDVALPFTWDFNEYNSESSEKQEFEFSLTISNSGPNKNSHDGMMSSPLSFLSPADDLFYKGQLLPLHLHRRISMLEQLSSPKKMALHVVADEEHNSGMNNKTLPGIHSDADVQMKLSSCTLQSEEGDDMEEEFSQEFESLGDAPSWFEGKMHCDPRKLEAQGGPWSNLSNAQDVNVFPQCYQDSALPSLMETDGRNGYAKCHSSSWRRPSLRWKVRLPGSRRNLKHDDMAESGSLNCPSVKNKDPKGRGLSLLNLTASASLLKSLFASGEMRVHEESKILIRSDGIKEMETVRNYQDMVGQRGRASNVGKATHYFSKYSKLLKSVCAHVVFSQRLQKEGLAMGNGAAFEGPSKMIDRNRELTPRQEDSSQFDNMWSLSCSSTSCLQEAQSAIKGAIAHCKQSGRSQSVYSPDTT